MILSVYLSKEDREISVEECGFSTRVLHAMRRRGIDKVGQIISNLPLLIKTPGFGLHCYEEICDYFVQMQIERFGIDVVRERLHD